jgi:hypothetical protein
VTAKVERDADSPIALEPSTDRVRQASRDLGCRGLAGRGREMPRLERFVVPG